MKVNAGSCMPSQEYMIPKEGYNMGLWRKWPNISVFSYANLLAVFRSELVPSYFLTNDQVWYC